MLCPQKGVYVCVCNARIASKSMQSMISSAFTFQPIFTKFGTPSWIWSNWKWRRSIRSPQKPHPRTKHEWIGWRVAELWPSEIFPKCVNGPWGRSLVVGQSSVAGRSSIGSRALSFKWPLLSVDVDVCESVCLCVQTLEVKYLENQRR